ncbi:hypothetical protein IPM65_03740 [Candidatus Roizmanbacteria bacterium]|nr:MAG: hypothetical protein IPM65_03740 [Candidatus Roizmanbacteria bacterium]
MAETTNEGSGAGMSMGMMMGIMLVVLLLILFFIFRGGFGMGGTGNTGGTDVQIPDKVDVNINDGGQ